MVTSAPPQLLTADPLAALPDDGARHELVAGVLRSMSPAGGWYRRIGATLLVLVGAYVREHASGALFTAETGFRLARDPDTVRAPDMAFVQAGRVAQADVPGFPPLAPDLVAEVVNPGDRAVEVVGKALAWLGAGVRLVWVIDPVNHTVTTYSPERSVMLRGEALLDGGTVLPGLTIPLPELWD